MPTAAQDLLLEVLNCQVDDLPTLSDVAVQVNRMTAGDDGSADELARVIARDQSLSARLLKVANSPAYGHRAQIESVQRAIVILGLREVRSIALSVAAFEAVGSRRPMRRRFQRSILWDHSQHVGLIAEALARNELGLGSGYYVHGLIHDIGKVALDAFRSADFDRVLDRIGGGERSWCRAEAEIIGADHAQIGRAILEHWNFPPSLAAAVGGHHQPWTEFEDGEAAGLIWLADLMARGLGHSSSPQDRVEDLGELLDDDGRAYLDRQGWRINPLLIERVNDHVRSLAEDLTSLTS